MTRPFQFNLRALFGHLTLFAIGLESLRLIGQRAGPPLSGCLVELSALAFGASFGIFGGRTWYFAGLFAIVAAPVALMVMEVVAGIDC